MSKESSSTTPPVFRSNCEVAIHVPDLAKAEAFYAGTLGFRVASRSVEYVELDTGALRLFVIPNAGAPKTFIPSYDVEDYATARRHLENAGCATVPARDGESAGYFQDPFGFVFDIIERRNG